MDALDRVRGQVQALGQAAQIVTLRRRIDLDRQERCGVDLDRDLRGPDRADQPVQIGRALHLLEHEAAALVAGAALFELADDPLHLALVDLTIGLGGGDHRPQNQLRAIFQFLLLARILRFAQTKRRLSGSLVGTRRRRPHLIVLERRHRDAAEQRQKAAAHRPFDRAATAAEQGAGNGPQSAHR